MQYPGHRAYEAELAVSSQRWPKPSSVFIAPTQRDGKAEWAWIKIG